MQCIRILHPPINCTISGLSGGIPYQSLVAQSNQEGLRCIVARRVSNSGQETLPQIRGDTERPDEEGGIRCLLDQAWSITNQDNVGEQTGTKTDDKGKRYHNLNIPKKWKEHMRMDLSNFPDGVINQCNLREFSGPDGKVHVEISKRMYGLLIASRITQDLPEERLAKHGYHQSRYTPSLWTYK